MKRHPHLTGFLVILVLLALPSIGAAEIALAPVYVEGAQGTRFEREVAHHVQRAARICGTNPRRSDQLRPYLSGADRSQELPASWWLEIGRQLGVDGVLVVRASLQGEELVLEARALNVETTSLHRLRINASRRSYHAELNQLITRAMQLLGGPEEELRKVEQALGGDYDSEYARYLETPSVARPPFAQHKYWELQDRARNGALLAGLVPPLVITGAALLTALVWRPQDWEDCSNADEEEHDFCGWGDLGSKFGFFLTAFVGAGGAAGSLAAGLSMLIRARRKMRKLEPLLGSHDEKADSGVAIALSPLITHAGPAGASLTIRF